VATSIRTRDAGGAVVVEIIGKLTLGEGSPELRSCVRDLVEQHKTRIVLDLSQVPYLDSSGIGDLVNAFTATSARGGKVTLSHPRLRSMDVMTITKLKSVFEITSSVEEALSGIQSDRLMFLCSVIECETWSPLSNAATEYQTCTRCGSQSKLVMTGGEENMSSVKVDHVRIPTYQDELVSVIPGKTRRVELHGRLDLFACNSAKKAVLTLKAAVFDLTAATEITPRGCSALFELMTANDSTAFLPKGRSLPVAAPGDERIVFDEFPEAEQAHFAALERSARRRGTQPIYERHLHTYLLR
jgi:anti-sigma B factor antagonist